MIEDCHSRITGAAVGKGSEAGKHDTSHLYGGQKIVEGQAVFVHGEAAGLLIHGQETVAGDQQPGIVGLPTPQAAAGPGQILHRIA